MTPNKSHINTNHHKEVENGERDPSPAAIDGVFDYAIVIQDIDKSVNGIQMNCLKQ